MAKVIHENKECEVLSVETEWNWCQGKRQPMDTWLLLNIGGYLVWVNKDDCKGIE